MEWLCMVAFQRAYILFIRKNMNKLFHFFSAVFIGLIAASFNSCMNNDGNSNWSTFNDMAVTVSGNELDGYTLYTDFDVKLTPANLSHFPELKSFRRARISFNVINESVTNVSDLDAGKTYEIQLNSVLEIPTYISCVDTLSEDYQIFGQDSIAIKNKAVWDVSQTFGQYYVKNGYLNVIPTFYYDPYCPISFLLYYDGARDIDTTNRKAVFNLYFDNNTSNAYYTISSLVCFRMSDEVYSRFVQAGVNESDSVTVCLNVNTQKGVVRLEYKAALNDFMLP